MKEAGNDRPNMQTRSKNNALVHPHAIWGGGVNEYPGKPGKMPNMTQPDNRGRPDQAYNVEHNKLRNKVGNRGQVTG